MSSKQQQQQESRICSVCGKDQSKDQYSKNQWKKNIGSSKCIPCVAAIANNNHNSSTNNNGGVDHSGQTNQTNRSKTKIYPLPSNNESGKHQQQQQPPTEISLLQRPQINVPGFEEIGLTVCGDWPNHTKNGQPPNAQSAIFMPLIACVVGESLDGYFTAEQLNVASTWWTQALPAWPRWIESLRSKVGVANKARQQFMKLVDDTNNPKRKRSNPNPLIFKAKGHGIVPHLKGANQVELIEMDSMVAIELYACIACMYNK